MPPRKSCADRLHQLQQDMGFTQKELKEAVKRHTTPKEVPLPTFHEKVSKYEKLRMKEAKKAGKRRKYKVVYWYLEKYLHKAEARKIYESYSNFKQMVDDVYEMALGLIQLQTFVIDEDPPVEKLLRDLEGPPVEGKYDIPEELDREFDAYCKKHPLKSAKDIIPRRQKFRKYRRKKRKTLYSKRNMRIYDPIFANSQLDAKRMVKDLERIGRENKIRCQKFKEMMEQLVSDHSVGADALRIFDKRTEVLMQQHEKRLDQFMRQAGLKPNRVMFDFSELY